jgi:hypothetical protein
MSKYCCRHFESDCNVDRRARPNIRIVKIDITKVPEINHKYPYRFYFTVGYTEEEKNVPSRLLYYCPYCGKDLLKFYRSDEYVNENNHCFLHM